MKRWIKPIATGILFGLVLQTVGDAQAGVVPWQFYDNRSATWVDVVPCGPAKLHILRQTLTPHTPAGTYLLAAPLMPTDQIVFAGGTVNADPAGLGTVKIVSGDGPLCEQNQAEMVVAPLSSFGIGLFMTEAPVGKSVCYQLIDSTPTKPGDPHTPLRGNGGLSWWVQ